jgi:hypothetical protein
MLKRILVRLLASIIRDVIDIIEDELHIRDNNFTKENQDGK